MQLAKHRPAVLQEMRVLTAEVERAALVANVHLSASALASENSAAALPLVAIETPPPSTTAAVEPAALPPLVSASPPNGRPRVILKKLSNKHKQAIALVLQGMSRVEVSEAVGFVPEYVTMLLQQPLAKEHIANVNRALDTQLEGLYEKSVEVIAKGLRHQDPDVALRAAKVQMQATGRLEPRDEGKKTAEDVVSAILLGVNVNVRTGA